MCLHAYLYMSAYIYVYIYIYTYMRQCSTQPVHHAYPAWQP